MKKDNRRVYVVVSGLGSKAKLVEGIAEKLKLEVAVPFFTPIELPYTAVKELIEAGAEVYGRVKGSDSISVKLDNKFIKRRESQIAINAKYDEDAVTKAKKIKEREARRKASADTTKEVNVIKSGVKIKNDNNKK